MSDRQAFGRLPLSHRRMSIWNEMKGMGRAPARGGGRA